MRTRLIAATVVTAVLAGVGGCVGSSSPDATHQTTAGSGAPGSAAPSGVTAQQYYSAVASAAPAASTAPVGSGDGTLDGGAFHVDVLSVQAWSDATVVTFVLSGTAELSATAMSQLEDWGFTGLASLSVVEPSGTVLRPALYNPNFPGEPDRGGSCACAAAPRVRADGTVLTAFLAPLDAAVTAVTVRMPGLTDITDVPVTRAEG